MLRFLFILNFAFCIINSVHGQIKWRNVDSIYQPLPKSVHVYYTDDSLDNAPFRAFYLIADLKNKELDFTVDTSKDRRLTPQTFYERNGKALAVVNTTFFSYETNRSLNLVVKDGKILEHNIHSIPLRGKDTLKYFHTSPSAIGILDGYADVAWTITKKSNKKVWFSPDPVFWIDSFDKMKNDSLVSHSPVLYISHAPSQVLINRWKIKCAVGGGPVLLENGNFRITNEEERKFAGKAIHDKHPRTAMGYSSDGKLLILVIEGRNPKASGATLTQEAQILKDLGCWEALNLDGGGSSCLLINGKETIKVSDAAGQRPVPAVFVIKERE